MRRLFLAIVLIAFAANEVNAQRNSNNRRNRAQVTQQVQRPNVRVVKVGKRDRNGRGFFAEERLRTRTGIYNRPLRRGTYIYNYNRPTRVISLRNQIRPFFRAPSALAIYNSQVRSFYRADRLAQQVLIDELNEQLYEDIRARKLFKFVNKPSNRNRKKLIKWNILTGRDKFEDINE